MCDTSGSRSERVVIIGAGPAGLTAAYELIKLRVPCVVIEKNNHVGGIARTEQYKGFHFDIGGHRFFTKVPEVESIWHEIMGDEFLKVHRLSHILYEKRFFYYPLQFADALRKMGIPSSTLVLLSYVQARLSPNKPELSFEDWATNRFGKRLYRMFFKAYTEKVWGLPCKQISAEWADQRIRGLSLMTVAWNALFKSRGKTIKSLTNEFWYPVLGSGMVWMRMKDKIEAAGGEFRLNSEVTRVNRDGNLVHSVSIRDKNGQEETIFGNSFISSMPLAELLPRIDPSPPQNVLLATKKLSYRNFIIVILILNKRDVFPDHWLYVHNPGVKVARIQNFKNWSSRMVPDRDRTSLGLEYFSSSGDSLSLMSDNELIELAKREVVELGLATESAVVDATVARQPKAYPIYYADYGSHLQEITSFLRSLANFQTVGRNGLHKYNNMDHSMLTGILAVRNILGESYDIWKVNVDQSYLEEIQAQPVTDI